VGAAQRADKLEEKQTTAKISLEEDIAPRMWEQRRGLTNWRRNKQLLKSLWRRTPCNKSSVAKGISQPERVHSINK